ncbi:MAG: pitrilysin family protein [Candidatus Wildermuthbacteria bacterium]|nr:pitrilysin family protein [Candidatus Wildermuthbacteria bacterium]
MFYKTTLKNGLRIVTVPHKDTRAVAVFVLVGTGSKYETKDKIGISHFLEHMFFKGTKKRPNAIAVTEPIDRVGGMFNAFTGTDYTGYFVKVEYEHQDLALDIVSDIFLNSILPVKEIAKEKGVVIEEIHIFKDNPMRRAETLWQQLLHGDQPAGWEIAGSRETVMGLSQKDLLQYMDSQYVAKNTVVCVAGRIDHASVTKKVEKLFSSIPASEFRKKLKVKEYQTKPQVLVEHRVADQTRIVLGSRGYNFAHPLHYAQEVMAVLLGGMFSSRLFVEVREKLGIAYDINTSSDSDPDVGHLTTSAGVPHDKVEKAITTILREYQKLARTKVSSKELQKSKDHIKGVMALGLEASEAKASFFGMQELLEKQILTPEQIHAKIEKVSPALLQRAAKEMFVRNKLNLVVVGPSSSKTKKKFENILAHS